MASLTACVTVSHAATSCATRTSLRSLLRGAMEREKGRLLLWAIWSRCGQSVSGSKRILTPWGTTSTTGTNSHSDRFRTLIFDLFKEYLTHHVNIAHMPACVFVFVPGCYAGFRRLGTTGCCGWEKRSPLLATLLTACWRCCFLNRPQWKAPVVKQRWVTVLVLPLAITCSQWFKGFNMTYC
jgi:hypothetical protein